MENESTAAGSTTSKNILLGLAEKRLSKNELAVRAGIPSSTFYRKLEHPEQFTLKDLGCIAQALEIPFVELLKDAA